MAEPRRARFKSPADGRELAWQALCRREWQEAYSSLLFSKMLKDSQLDARERAQATQYFYGVLERGIGLDACLQPFSRIALAELEVPLKNALRLAAWQFYFAPHIPARAAAFSAVELVKRYGHEGLAKYCNAVLRALLRRLPEFPQHGAEGACVSAGLYEELGLALSAPPLCADELGVKAYWQSLFRERRLNVRVQQLNCPSETELRRTLTAAGALVETAEWPEHCLQLQLNGLRLTELSAWREGQMIAQGRAAQLPALIGASLLQKTKRKRPRCLDFCAAPGGKSLQLYDALGGETALLACDLFPERVEKIRENAARLRVTDALRCLVRDASLPLPPAERSSYDLVLADVPCSASGLLGQKPELRFRDKAVGEDLLALQAKILDNAADALKVGGFLIYSTCSILPEENQAQIRRFLLNCGGRFTLDPLGEHLPESLRRQTLSERQLADTPGMLNCYPHIHASEGFFIALLRRES